VQQPDRRAVLGDLAAVEPFLVNLFSDREIIELPFGAAR